MSTTRVTQKNSGADPTIRVVLVTMDSHLVSAAHRSSALLQKQFSQLKFDIHAASEWGNDPLKLTACIEDIQHADIIIATMLFLEDHFIPILPALKARRDHCDALIGAMSASEVTRLTKLGQLDMAREPTGLMGLLKKLKPATKQTQTEHGRDTKTETRADSGERQMRLLRQLPKFLRFIPGTAQDLRAYFLCLQYWLAGSENNLAAMVHLLIDRYAKGDRASLRHRAKTPPPVEYPDTGLYHPQIQGASGRLTTELSALPRVAQSGRSGTVGLILLRSYLLAGNTGHYDGVITALEAQGLKVIPAFATGLDSRPAIDRYFFQNGKPAIDALVSLTGFSLVGGPAYNDARAAEEVLARLDVPYLSVAPVEFQTIDDWDRSERGLLPVEATMMVALPELDGATGCMVFGGRREGVADAHDMCAHTERAFTLASRVSKLIALRKSELADRRIAVVLFNFPPNAGNTGTAAFLAVFESLFNTLKALKEKGYSVEMPASVDALRQSIINGNAQQLGAPANVATMVSVDTHVRQETWLDEIENQWGPAPGRQLSDGRSLFILGHQFGNVLVGIQPGMGFEGDPMRLLFSKGSTPTHAFSAFYRYLRKDFGAHAILHFGTHGALEFMPGKQVGLSGRCWPDRLIGDCPNFYLYASNNPSEGAIAKRRGNATLVSYLTPSLSQAGLYKELIDLKSSLDRYRSLGQDSLTERQSLIEMIQDLAERVELIPPGAGWSGDELSVVSLTQSMLELEYTLIPHGLHVVGSPMSRLEQIDLLMALAQSNHGQERMPAVQAAIEALVDGKGAEQAAQYLLHQPTQGAHGWLSELERVRQLAIQNSEIDGLLKALDGRFIRPAPGADLLRSTDVLPTGRNLHGFDPFRIPSAFAVQDGERQAKRLLARHMADGNPLPESIALVLWGTDNLKSEGAPIAQALALLGARPRFDSYGRLAGATLIPLSELGRPRIDVVLTLSGIFRDLLPLQIKLLAEASYLAACADEDVESNFVRKHALSTQAEQGCDLETAALRVFGNAEGAYGANVNLLIDCSGWQDDDQLAETYSRRKGFAYGRNGKANPQPKIMEAVLSKVELAYQNLESVELGVTTVDTYFDTLGGISKAVQRARKSAGHGNSDMPVYISDQTQSQLGSGVIRTLSEQVALETRTRTLNPKWYEGLLEHGYEGVRQIEQQLTNTMGWSATTGQVQPWVYQKISETFILDEQMRERLAKLNPTASAKVANRLLEASQREFWKPDAQTLAALQQAGEELEDRLEGLYDSKPDEKQVVLKQGAKI